MTMVGYLEVLLEATALDVPTKLSVPHLYL